MTTNTRRGTKRLAQQTTELAMAVPQVVAHRVTRMMTAGPQPSAQDQREFHRMGAEKAAAFSESWMAMGAHCFSLQQQWLQTWARIFWTPWLGGLKGGNAWSAVHQFGQLLQNQWQRAAVSTATQGLAPIHQRAVANAKRLSRVKKT
jgi:hypothetical protein